MSIMVFLSVNSCAHLCVVMLLRSNPSSWSRRASSSSGGGEVSEYLAGGEGGETNPEREVEEVLDLKLELSW